MWLLYLIVSIPVLYAVYNRFFHPLAHIPGPFLAAVSPLWLVYQTTRHRRPRLDVALHQRYGSVVRIRPNEVIFSNPDYFKQVYGAGTKFTKGSWYDTPTADGQPPGYERLDMLTERDLDKLRLQKRHAGVVYSMNNVRRHETLIDNNIQRFVKRLRGFAHKALNFYPEIELFLVDAMTELTFAQPFGAVEAGTDGGHMHSMKKMWAWWAWIGLLPSLSDLYKTYSPWKSFIFSPGELPVPVFRWVGQQISEYNSAPGDTKRAPCMLDDLLELAKSKPAFLPSWGIALSITDEGAGVDTGSWTIATVIAGIVTNAEVYNKVKAEIFEAENRGDITRDQPVSYEAAAKMTYLQDCIHEAQRMWPNVAPSLSRVVPPGGMDIDGYYIPAGQEVGMCSKVLGLNPEVFGPQTDKFRPERWSEASKAQRNDMDNRNLAFGGPSRKCVGMHLAWLVVSKTVASLLFEFELRVLNEMDGKPGPGGQIWRETGMFPTQWEGFEVSVESRSKA